jgi:hypothetical protein
MNENQALLSQALNPGLALTSDDYDIFGPRVPRYDDPKPPKIEVIQGVVMRQYNVSRLDLLSARHNPEIVWPRQVGMYLARKLTLRSLPDIGQRFGGRHHSTVLHAVRKIKWLVGERDFPLTPHLKSIRDKPVDPVLIEEIAQMKRELFK